MKTVIVSFCFVNQYLKGETPALLTVLITRPKNERRKGKKKKKKEKEIMGSLVFSYRVFSLSDSFSHSLDLSVGERVRERERERERERDKRT